MAQIKPPVRSLEDIEDSLSSSPKEIDDNLQGRNPDAGDQMDETGDSPPKRTFYKSSSEEEDPLDREEPEEEDKEKPDKPAESEKPENDEDPLEAEEDESEPKPEPVGHLGESGQAGGVDDHDGKDDEMVEEYAKSKDFKEGMYPESGSQNPDVRNQKSGERTLDDLADEETSEEERTDWQPIDDTNSHEDLHIPNLRSPKPQPRLHSSTPNPTSYQGTDGNFTSRYADRPKNSSKLPLVFLAIIGIGVLGTSVYLLKGQLRSFKNVLGINTVAPSPSPQPSASPSLSPTPIPTPDRSKFKIRVLNGTTKTGLAASESAKLKDLGYQIDKAGNAPTQDYKTTQVKIKSPALGLADQLVKDLAPDFTASTSGTLKDSDTADGEVILGSK